MTTGRTNKRDGKAEREKGVEEVTVKEDERKEKSKDFPSCI
jgi:hypothetical protein